MEIIVVIEQKQQSFVVGDVWKVQPNNWHKYFEIPKNMVMVKALKGNFRELKRKLTSCGVDSRRRYSIDLDRLGKKRTVLKIDKYILDKEA